MGDLLPSMTSGPAASAQAPAETGARAADSESRRLGKGGNDALSAMPFALFMAWAETAAPDQPRAQDTAEEPLLDEDQADSAGEDTTDGQACALFLPDVNGQTNAAEGLATSRVPGANAPLAAQAIAPGLRPDQTHGHTGHGAMAAAEPMDDQPETGADGAQPLRLGAFELAHSDRVSDADRSQPRATGIDKPRALSASPEGPQQERESRPPAPRDFGERLRQLLDGHQPRTVQAIGSRGRQEDSPAGGRDAQSRTPATATPDPQPLAEWTARSPMSLPTGASRPATTPAADVFTQQTMQAIRDLLPAQADQSAPGIRLSFESQAHGSVGLDVRCSDGQLFVTVRLQQQLSPEAADSFRRDIAIACQERGYAHVDVEVRGDGSHQGGRRHGHAADEDVRLSGKEFPEEEVLASPARRPAPGAARSEQP